MFQQIKALIVILPIAFGVFFIARMAFADFIEPKRIDRWRNLFIAVTAAGFLIPNFWAALLAMVILVVVLGHRETVWPALFLLLLFALPPVGMRLPGFAGINNFIQFTPQLVLVMAILLPALLNAKRMKKLASGGTLTDVFFVLYIGLTVVLAFRGTTFTDGLRDSITLMLHAVPVYFVFSRWPKTIPDIRLVTAAFVIPLLVMAAVAIPEFVIGWHFYADVLNHWGFGGASYTLRSGFLRAYGSVLGPIAFGVFLMTALTLSLPLISSGVKKIWARGGILVFVGGLFSSLSRGPWIGAVLSVCAFILTGPRAVQRFIMLSIGGVFGLAALSATETGSKIIDLLPFIGDAEGGTITYRQRLAEAGWKAVMDNPFFGTVNIRQVEEFQDLVTGQGFVDLVNSYLTIALSSGLIGLALFLGAHLTALYSVWSSSRKARDIAPELAVYARGYFAAHFGILVVIATTSSVAQIVEMYWMVAGMAVALTRMTNAALAEAKKGVATASSTKSPADAPDAGPAPAMARKASAKIDPNSLPPHLRQYVKK